MTAEPLLPAITLTDPNNDPSSPARPFSPIKDGSIPSDGGGWARSRDGRPETPSRRSGGGRGTSPNGNRTSPGKLIRTLSSSNGTGNPSGPTWDEMKATREGEAEALAPPMDPLSQHILRRTNAPPPIVTTGRPATSNGGSREDARGSSAEPASAAPAVQPLRKVDTNDSFASTTQPVKDLRKGVKAVSFISRLMGSKKKDDSEIAVEDEANSNEGRPEGTDAEVFAKSMENIGYSPRQPQPPAYIKVRAKYKKERDFDRLFLAQELECRKRRKVDRRTSSNKLRRKNSSSTVEADTVWAMEFSKDGKYLAAAGADGVVRVWSVLSSADDRRKHEQQEAQDTESNSGSVPAEHLSAPVFQSQPIREFEGHTATVLDLSWSKNNFLLSSSMDKTVRLWHVIRAECLCTFKHADFVPSIAFHPKDDRFFLAGSLDSRLRLWSIPDKNVAFTARVPDMITAVAFTPDGKYAMAGCLSGLLMFYETEGMKYQSQVHVRSARGHNAKGSKITGIQAYHTHRGDVKLLITSNDSRVRLYNFRDKNLEMKFRGNVNNSSQIRATLSDDGRYVVCGSEDRKAYIWSTGPSDADKRDRRPLETFDANDTMTTAMCFAPTKTRLLLAKSEDPVYDLCNPPPVTLMSQAERAESRSSSRPPSQNGSIQATPKSTDADNGFQKPRESASYLAKSTHKNGNIIVTADLTGRIKVFRQDCAWAKRRNDDDRASIFSKRTGRLSQNGSVMTKGSQPSLREQRTSMSSSVHSERILSWRQGIASTPSLEGSGGRSVSPRMSGDYRRNLAENGSGGIRKGSNGSWSGFTTKVRSETPPTSAPSTGDMKIDTAKARAAADDAKTGRSSPGSNGSPKSVRDENPLFLAGGRSYMFWDTDEWKDRAKKIHDHNPDELPLTPIASREDRLAVRPEMRRGATAVSELSDEKSSVSSVFEDAHDDGKDGGQPCRRCGGQHFGLRKLPDGGTEYVCTGCGGRTGGATT